MPQILEATPPWLQAGAAFEFSQEGLSMISIPRAQLASNGGRILIGNSATPPGSLHRSPFELLFRRAGGLSRRGRAAVSFLLGLHRARETCNWGFSPPLLFSDCQVRFRRGTPPISSEALGWNREPIRRRNHRRKRKTTQPINNPLKSFLIYMVVGALSLHYYTHQVRSSPTIVLMDSLIVYSITYRVHRLGLRVFLSVISFCRGYPSSLLDRLQSFRNRLMHALNGNRDTDHTATIEEIFDTRIKLSREALLGMRAPGYTADFTPPTLHPRRSQARGR